MIYIRDKLVQQFDVCLL